MQSSLRVLNSIRRIPFLLVISLLYLLVTSEITLLPTLSIKLPISFHPLIPWPHRGKDSLFSNI